MKYNIELIRGFIRTYLDFLTTERIKENYWYPDGANAKKGKCTWVGLNDQERAWLEKTAIAIFLDDWLEHDLTWRRTVRDFAVYEYKDIDVEKRKGYSDSDEAKIKRLERVGAVFLQLRKRREEQIEDENSGLPEISEENFGLIDLRWIELYSEGKLNIIKELYYPTTSKTISEQDRIEKLKETYKQLFLMFSGISTMYDNANTVDKDETSEDFRERKAREYRKIVASYMAIRRIEQSNRLILYLFMAALAYKWRRTPIINSTVFYSFWGRYQSERIKYNPEGKYRGQVVVDASQDVVNYRKNLKIVFENKSDRKTFEKQKILRAILSDLVVFLNTFVFQTLGWQAWTDENFEDAVKFYREEYNFIGEYLQERKKLGELFRNPRSENEIYQMCFELLFPGDAFSGSMLRNIQDANASELVDKRNSKWEAKQKQL